MTKYALEIKHLNKTYRNGVIALKDINLSVEDGDIFAFLGPNGAGKSTVIGIITTLVNITSGEVKVYGKDIMQHPEITKQMIGVVPQEYNLNQFIPIIETMVNIGGYFGLSKKQALSKTQELFEDLGIWHKRESTPRELSGGMKRRLMVAKALVNNPDLLILDEPSAGVDIELRRSLWDFLREINEKGTTIILTTHYLEEAEKLCKNISIINEGSIVKTSSMNSLLSELETQNYLFELKNSFPHNVDHARFNLKLLSDHLISVNVNQENSLNQIINFFSENNIEVFNMTNETNRLEELFLNLTNIK
mgnify:CR=1 FL=1